MKTYIWDNLKKKIACDAYSNTNIFNIEAMTAALRASTLEEGKNDWRGKLQELKDKVYETVMAWDIRTAKKLFDAFPHSICKWERGLTPTATQDEKGRWVIVFDC